MSTFRTVRELARLLEEQKKIHAAVQALAESLRKPERIGDGPCQDCDRANVIWYADNEMWNLVMGGPEAKDDPGGLLCPTCFIVRAELLGIGPRAWWVGVKEDYS